VSCPLPALACFLTLHPCLTLCPGLQCLEPCSSGFLSPASRLNAGGALGHGRCSALHSRMSMPEGFSSLCGHSQPCHQAQEGQGPLVHWILTTLLTLSPGLHHANELSNSKASTHIHPKLLVTTTMIPPCALLIFWKGGLSQISCLAILWGTCKSTRPCHFTFKPDGFFPHLDGNCVGHSEPSTHARVTLPMLLPTCEACTLRHSSSSISLTVLYLAYSNHAGLDLFQHSYHTNMEIPLPYMVRCPLTYLVSSRPNVFLVNNDPGSFFAIPGPPCPSAAFLYPFGPGGPKSARKCRWRLGTIRCGRHDKSSSP